MDPRLSGQNCNFFKFLLSHNSQIRLGNKETPPNIGVCLESPLAMSEYWYIERGLLLLCMWYLCREKHNSVETFQNPSYTDIQLNKCKHIFNLRLLVKKGRSSTALKWVQIPCDLRINHFCIQEKPNTDYHIFPFVVIFVLTIQVIFTAKIVYIIINNFINLNKIYSHTRKQNL